MGSDCRIRPFIESDLKVLPALTPEGWGDIAAPFSTYLTFECCHPIAVDVQGVLAGVGCAIGFGRTGWLAHVIVSPDYRRQGLGTKIVHHLMELLLGQGVSTVSLIATAEGYPRYKAAGFREQTEYLFLAKDPSPEPLEPFGTMEARDVEAMLRLDREYSGEDRSPFLLRCTTGGLLFRRDGITTGFWLPALGEGLVIASENGTGRMVSAMRSRVTGRCVLPAENEGGIVFYTHIGFQETKRCFRMIYGPEFPWKPEGIYSRIGGNLG